MDLHHRSMLLHSQSCLLHGFTSPKSALSVIRKARSQRTQCQASSQDPLLLRVARGEGAAQPLRVSQKSALHYQAETSFAF